MAPPRSRSGKLQESDRSRPLAGGAIGQVDSNFFFPNNLGLRVEYRPLDALIPFARNARTHSDTQISQIAASIREFGFTNPILLDGANGIIAGHGRLAAVHRAHGSGRRAWHQVSSFITLVHRALVRFRSRALGRLAKRLSGVPVGRVESGRVNQFHQMVPLEPRAEGPVGAADGEGDVPLLQQGDRLTKNPRTGRVNVHHRLRIQHEPADRGGRLRDQPLDVVKEQGRVGEVERSAEAVNHQAGRTGGLPVVRGEEVTAVGRFQERRGVRTGRPPDHIDDRKEKGDHDGAQRAQGQHAQKADRGDPELRTAHPPQLFELVDLDQRQHRVGDDPGQGRIRQVGQQVGEEEHHQR